MLALHESRLWGACFWRVRDGWEFFGSTFECSTALVLVVEIVTIEVFRLGSMRMWLDCLTASEAHQHNSVMREPVSHEMFENFPSFASGVTDNERCLHRRFMILGK